jgi:beta-xylosidase
MFLRMALSVILLFSIRIAVLASTDTTLPGVTLAAIPGDFADPSVITVNGVFYATGTSSEWAPHFPLFVSGDMITWKQAGYVFIQQPAWTTSSFWAPELFYHQGTFYVYYVAKRKSDGVSCIGVATAQDPLKGFTDHGIIVAHGKEAIDPFVFSDSGRLYMTYKAYGLDQRPIEILGARLSADGLKMEGEPFTLLRDDARIGLEGQALVKRNDFYYLLYSAGNCCGLTCSYNVRVARATVVQGPYTDYEHNPILTDYDAWKCPGHGTIVQQGLNRDMYMFHAYNKKEHVFTGRQAMARLVIWNKATNWPYFMGLGYHTSYEPYNIYDKFDRAPVYWQWDFRHAEPNIHLEKGNLLLSGKIDTSNHTGTAITVRPVTGNYEMQTAAINNNASLKGLVLYGDADRAVGIGIRDSTLVLWDVKNNQRTELATHPLPGGIGRLKMVVKDGYQCRFYCTTNNTEWIELKAPGTEFYDASHLPPWDRSPRPGLLHFGNLKDLAVFSFFSIQFH